MSRTPLYGHTSPETAYLVADYPYSFNLRCKIRYWLEHNGKRGFRFVSQTENPKTGRWNAPKSSTYVPIAAAMYLDDQGRVQWDGLGGSDPIKALEFLLTFPGADLTVLRIFARQAAAPTGLLAKLASGEARFSATVNGVESPTSAERREKDLADYREQLAVWMRIAEKIG